VSCPTSAIGFPSTDLVLQLGERPEVRHAIEDSLLSRREELAFGDLLPDSDHLIHMEIRSIVDVSVGTRLLRLTPHRSEACMCQFTPGQCLEVWILGTEYTSRGYSIGNSPHEDGSVELHFRKVEGGRMSEWVFGRAAIGDVVTVRGPVGAITLRSPGDQLLFLVARGTGFAPIKAIVEHGVGGPQDPSRLYAPGDIEDDFVGTGLVVGRAERVLRPVPGDAGEASAIDTLVRAIRPG
jgi:CDP-4-dehydro-6-deoxyglucose reductase